MLKFLNGATKNKYVKFPINFAKTYFHLKKFNIMKALHAYDIL